MKVTFIQHRCNSVDSIKNLSLHFGAEIDLRYHNQDLVLSHDPFHGDKAELFIDFLNEWSKLQDRGPLILNTKTEGIEDNCIFLMNKFKITNWFFLDLSMPYFVKYSHSKISNPIMFNENNLAVRFSEHEPMEYALSFANKVGWVWVDCFTKMPLTADIYQKLKDHHFKICLVSPELQKHDVAKIGEYKKQLSIHNLFIDAICTKRPDLWH